MKKISIIVPAYNEEANLQTAIDRISAVIDGLSGRYEFEVILLDNASTDSTPSIATEQAAKDPRWKYLRYSRNFGAEASMLAGLDHSSGDAVINVFSDMQDPPEKIPEMIGIWENGAEMVYGVVQERHDSTILKTIGAKIAYKLIRALASSDIPANATDFRLLDRAVVDVLVQMREPDRYLRGLVHWVGFKQAPFYYDRSPRKGGRSTANLIYCIRFALHAIVCFSSVPVHLAMLFGLFMTAASGVLSVLYLILFFWRPSFLNPPPPGTTTIMLLALLIIGINSLFLGIIGEYVGRIYNQGKKRPLYVVSRSVNIAAKSER